MSSKTKRLGTLADIYQSENLDGSITRIRLNRIRPSEEQPRQDRTVGVDGLAESLRNDGLLEPIIVAKEKNHYRIIAGERRYHAATKLDWEEVECRIISRKEQDYWRIAIIENLQREDLSAGEEASALMRLKKQEKLSDEQLSKVIGKSRNYISEILGIAQLSEETLKRCRELGIEQRNMLIQVVQSHRKGTLNSFLENYRTGTIQTVRKARQFNQNKTKTSSPSSPRAISLRRSNTPFNTNQSEAEHVGFRFKVQEDTITIQCPGAEEARRLVAKIRTQIPL